MNILWKWRRWRQATLRFLERLGIEEAKMRWELFRFTRQYCYNQNSGCFGHVRGYNRAPEPHGWHRSSLDTHKSHIALISSHLLWRFSELHWKYQPVWKLWQSASEGSACGSRVEKCCSPNNHIEDVSKETAFPFSYDRLCAHGPFEVSKMRGSWPVLSSRRGCAGGMWRLISFIALYCPQNMESKDISGYSISN